MNSSLNTNAQLGARHDPSGDKGDEARVAPQPDYGFTIDETSL